ncbi:MAG: GNAT family N-acetyltransferase [Spirosomaceae bacterium]|nr:GNAT family N-acetyltransferase [Spirosomataceae bacterium]
MWINRIFIKNTNRLYSTLKSQPNKMPIHYQVTENPSVIRDTTEALYQHIFAVSDTAKFYPRFETETDFMAVLAYNQTDLIGFKLGYRKSKNTFYSWLGGVLKVYRGQGVGQQLMQIQHQRCQEKGYAKIQTKTMNQWRKMLILNLQNGFEIVETYRDKEGELKIILEKSLIEKNSL